LLGGGVASLRYDPQGKGHAQMLMDFPGHRAEKLGRPGFGRGILIAKSRAE